MGSIKRKIIKNTAMIIAALSIAVIVILISTTTILTNSILLDVLQPMAKITAQNVEANIHLLANNLFLLADDDLLHDTAVPAQQKQQVLDKMKSGIEFMWLALYTPDGRLYTGSEGSPEEIAQMELLSLMKETENLVVGDTQVTGSGLQLPIGIPISDESGQTGYYLVGSYKYDMLNDVMSGIHLGYNGHAFIVNPQGRVVAHRDVENVQNKVDVFSTYREDTQLLELIDRAAAGGVGAECLGIQGEQTFAAYSPVRGTNWSLVIVAPRSDFTEVANQALLVTLLAVVVLLAFATLLVERFTRGISRSLGNVTRRIELLSEGDLSSPTEIVETRDEAQTLSVALKSTVETISGYLLELKEGLGNLSEGNLDVNVSGQFQGDFFVMKDSLNHIVDFLNRIIRELQLSAEKLHGAANGVEQTAQMVNASSERQADSVAVLSSQADMISESIEAVDQNATDARVLIRRVNDKLLSGEAQMRKMLAAMDNINRNAVEMGKITKLMEDISFQTNLLALNASVEAAHAGTAGKGFSVVAEEVRNLASKSAQSAKRTGEMLEHSRKQVDEGFRYAKQTAAAMEEIAAIAQEVSGITDQLTNSMESEKEALGRILGSIGAISDSMEQNLASSQESAAASAQLTQQAETLRQIAGRFRLRRGAEHDEKPELEEVL